MNTQQMQQQQLCFVIQVDGNTVCTKNSVREILHEASVLLSEGKAVHLFPWNPEYLWHANDQRKAA